MSSSAGVDIISYTVTNSCGPVAVTRTVTVEVHSPNAGVITGATSVCVGASIPLTDASTGGAWSSQSTSIALVTGGGDVFGLSGGTTNISYTVGNSCGALPLRCCSITCHLHLPWQELLPGLRAFVWALQ